MTKMMAMWTKAIVGGSCVRQVLQICIPKSRLIVVEAVGTVNRTFYPVQGAVGKLVL